MKNRQFIIFYFYLKVKISQIKKQISNINSDTGNQHRFKLALFLKRVRKAALVTFLLYGLILYLNLGKIIIPEQENLLELILGFGFLLVLFWFHRRISKFTSSQLFRNIKSPFREVLEVLLVIFTTLIVFLLVNWIPLQLIFEPEAFVPIRVRNAFGVSIVVSLFFYYFVERERSIKILQAEKLHSARLQKENYQAQLENLKVQMNPHFLFNSLNVLVSLIPKDADRATEFTRRLSDLYRSFLNNSSEQLIPLRKELEINEAYIYLLKSRFGEALNFNVQIASEVKDLQLPPGSLQVVLENAIKHNGSTRKKPLFIEIYSEGNSLVVKNNIQPRRELIESTNTGLKNIQSRYTFLSNKKFEYIKTTSHFIAKLPLLKVELS
jgi:sensor histidine kinase YesM